MTRGNLSISLCVVIVIRKNDTVSTDLMDKHKITYIGPIQHKNYQSTPVIYAYTVFIYFTILFIPLLSCCYS